MKDAIAFVLGNFTLTFFVLGLLASAIALRRATERSRAAIVEALFSYFLLFSIGFANFYNFILHVFFGEMSARFIGWENSPFQLEVGFACLGFAVLGFLAFTCSFDLLYDGPEGGPWVLRIPHELVSLVASLDDNIRGGVARRWAETEELMLDCWRPDAVADFLDKLCDLARRAVSNGKGLLMWMAL